MVDHSKNILLDLEAERRPALVDGLEICTIRISDEIHLELLVNTKEQIVSSRFAEIGTDMFEEYDDDFWADEDYQKAFVELIKSGELSEKLRKLPTTLTFMGNEYHFWSI
jgi:hypothetical protein